MFRSLDDNDVTSPGEELANFTNRVDELDAYQQVLDIPYGQPFPVLMFYGVGGTGKTWLLKKLHSHLSSLPLAYINLDRDVGGQTFLADSSRALAEIRRQFGVDIPCPRFDLAYTWLRFKEGDQSEPHFRGTGMLGNTWEFIVQAGSAAADDIPGINIISWLVEKAASPVKEWLKDNGVGDWLATKLRGREGTLIE